MVSFEFEASVGAQFGERGEDGRYRIWARFERVPDVSDGGKRYRFVTDDAKVAERLRAVDGYGITEAKADTGKPAPKRRAKSEEG